MARKKGRFDHITDDELVARLKASFARTEAETGRKITQADIDAMLIMGADPVRHRRALIAATNAEPFSYQKLSDEEIYQKYFLSH